MLKNISIENTNLEFTSQRLFSQVFFNRSKYLLYLSSFHNADVQIEFISQIIISTFAAITTNASNILKANPYSQN